jgi:hypothetical protein
MTLCHTSPLSTQGGITDMAAILRTTTADGASGEAMAAEVRGGVCVEVESTHAGGRASTAAAAAQGL